MEYTYTPQGVCSSKFIIEIDGDIIKSVRIIDGCPGNTMGVSKLVQGRKIDEIISLLEGIDCRGRGTSCPDQLAKALKDIKLKNKKS